jgi:hypothetical protein
LFNKEAAMASKWVQYLIEVLLPHPEGLARQDAIDRVAQRRRADGYSLPSDTMRTIQSAFNGHHQGSSEFTRRGRKPTDAFFYPVGGKGSGVWAVDPNKARAWLARDLH